MEKIVALIIFGLIVLGIISYLVGLYNRLIMLKNNIVKSFANIDVLLKQRTDEIPNLIAVVKESERYESELLSKLTQLRTDYLNTVDIEKKVQLSNDIEKALKSVIAVSENYPDLKTNAAFIQLQKRVSDLEDQIADRREFYNESVNMYNIGIAEFPAVIFARMMGYKEKSMLHISEEEKKYDGVKF
ncbi:LemA family protein [Bacteroides sp. 519]|uniref:LemA family protein n=1 Tax=Bacteroides sp. 519 TaxID=2302937 RepID=UPI0013D5D3A6|nr:LemA family protein [Bacteroides sp. 519]NDV57621.1 LemA family protein [Bacteroides sp. 519]